MTYTYQTPKITKREMFAAMAMQGMLCNPKILEKMDRIAESEGRLIPFVVAETAIGFADALIEALKPPKLPPPACAGCGGKAAKIWLDIPICEECWEKPPSDKFIQALDDNNRPCAPSPERP